MLAASSWTETATPPPISPPGPSVPGPWTAKRAARSPMPLEGKALAVGLTAAKPAPWKEEPKLQRWLEPRTPEKGGVQAPHVECLTRLSRTRYRLAQREHARAVRTPTARSARPAEPQAPAGRGAAGPGPFPGRVGAVRDRRHPVGAHPRGRGAAVRRRRARLPAPQPGHLDRAGLPGPPPPAPLRRVGGQHRPRPPPPLGRPALGGRPGRPGRRRRPRHLHPRRRRRGQPHRGPHPPHRPLVDDPGPAAGRRPQRPPRGGDRLRLPPAPPRPARLVARPRPRGQRPPPRRLPPLPGLRRLLRQPRPGPVLRPPLPAPRPHHPPGDRPLPDRRRRRSRLPRPPRPRLVAPGVGPAGCPQTLGGVMDRETATTTDQRWRSSSSSLDVSGGLSTTCHQRNGRRTGRMPA